MFPTLTVVRCDCCGRFVVDEVGLIAVCDAVRAHRDELAVRAASDRAAWQDAFAASDAAQTAAQTGTT